MTAAHAVRTLALTLFALIAFAANSVLTRMALGRASIDASSFATLRVVSGAATLLLVSSLNRRRGVPVFRGSWTSALMLFSYAVPFSFAYLSLSTGTGALILFGMVQVTMILAALGSGERPHAWQWAGLLLAFAGLVYLVFPGLTAPSPIGSLLMAVAGISWGLYSLWGRSTVHPLADTTGNFARAVPLVLGVSLVARSQVSLSGPGILLAILSGALASGVGYAVWYAALRGLTRTRAATVQLSVPVLAALGGVFFLSENVSLRLVLSAVLILGGVGIAIVVKERMIPRKVTVPR
ncbi:MAG TPA: DMT family transporter [Gemmatimonadales bacterium]|nr:DMT family transporter [Gemmatimonadales bacterium]